MTSPADRVVIASQLRGLDPDPREERLPDGRRALTRIRRGAFFPTCDWDELDPLSRHVVRVFAGVTMLCGEDPLLSHHSAAALWGLPVVGSWPSRLDVMIGSTTVRSTGLVRRHRRTDLPAGVRRGGLRVTTAARTCIDLARSTTLACGVAAADAALRAQLCTREELCDEIAVLPAHARGRARAALAAELADPRSESAGESLSRVRMFEQRFPKPELQVRVHDARGLAGRCDFGWSDHRLIGEFDGKVKYGRALRATQEAAAEALWAEKRREDRLRRAGASVARWSWADALAVTGLVASLREAGLRQLPRRVWL